MATPLPPFPVAQTQKQARSLSRSKQNRCAKEQIFTAYTVKCDVGFLGDNDVHTIPYRKLNLSGIRSFMTEVVGLSAPLLPNTKVPFPSRPKILLLTTRTSTGELEGM